jgi:acyl CoA:acetate/3-ketoacid CoA transferase alpha subunit
MKTLNKPAFPVEVSMDENGKTRGSQTSNFSGYEMGLTKREYFAAKAVQGLLSNPEWTKEYKGEKYLMQSAIIADIAIKTADNLLSKLSNEDEC